MDAFGKPRECHYTERNSIPKDVSKTLIEEEFEEWKDEAENPMHEYMGWDWYARQELEELADLVIVCFFRAETFGWDLEEAIKRKMKANMSKLGENGKPILRDDGKILKGPNYTPAEFGDLV